LNLTFSEPSKTIVASPREAEDTFFSKFHFQHMLRIERQRTERSKRPFLLALLDISSLNSRPLYKKILERIKSALASALRETDIRGWYDHDRIIGIIFTEMSTLDASSIEGVFRKLHDRLSDRLGKELIDSVSITFHIYPETNSQISLNGSFNIKLYPDLTKQALGYRFSMMIKKTVDVLGSSIGLLCLSPVFLAVALSIKLTSKGPVFFRQERLGLNGRIFPVLKFRSMFTNCDARNHKEYITKYIGQQKSAAVEPGVFKLTHDDRITPVGRWLRKTSLDELPQLINVVKGDMSLVGPRPPIPYEYDLYDIWHRRRLLSCKPGITGLWQVNGRSRTTFDEMVRLDLKYISEWSPWLDLKILLKTPKAVFGGKGAYSFVPYLVLSYPLFPTSC
jgi:lipopolysaccharide/colanic/teichoic acid biosynthesis glycosyltransferase